MVRFLHTADLQIGKPFNWAGERARRSLREAREESVTRIGNAAKEQEADFVLALLNEGGANLRFKANLRDFSP